MHERSDGDLVATRYKEEIIDRDHFNCQILFAVYIKQFINMTNTLARTPSELNSYEFILILTDHLSREIIEPKHAHTESEGVKVINNLPVSNAGVHADAEVIVDDVARDFVSFALFLVLFVVNGGHRELHLPSIHHHHGTQRDLGQDLH